MTKEYDQRYLTYTLFEYLHYIKDIPFSTTCLRFTACLR